MATVNEQNNRVEIVGTSAAPGRVRLNPTLDESDADISVRNTYSLDDSDNDYSWGVKADTATGARNVQALNEGFLAFVSGRADGAGFYTGSWLFKAGTVSNGGFIALSSRPEKMGISRSGNKLQVKADDQIVHENTNVLWGTLSNLYASFGADHDTTNQITGFNAFNVVNDSMPLDCYGTDGQGSEDVDSPHRIPSLMRFPELTGNEESFNAKTRESHVYMRPVGMSNFHRAFQVDWKSYQDGGETVVETVENVSHEGDIQNWREIQGRRIQHEINTNLSLWRMVGMDTHFWQEDKKNLEFGPEDDNDAKYQKELATDLAGWLARGSYTYDLVKQANMTSTDALTGPSVITGPDADGRGGISGTADEGNAWLESAETYGPLTDFTISMWINGRSDNGGFFTLGDSSDKITLYYLDTDNELGYFATGLSGIKRVNTGTITANEWHLFTYARSGSVISVYLDGEFKGTIGDASSRAGAGFALLYTTPNFADIRIYNKALSAEAIKYYHDNVIEGGDKVLPL